MRIVNLFVLVAVLTLSGCASTGDPESRATQNIRVVDGDTVEISTERGNETVRLIGIDTPETHAENTPREFDLPRTQAARRCLGRKGKAATRRVKSLVDSQNTSVSTDPAADRRGDYGRLLAYLYAGNTSVNRQLVEEGLARVYPSQFSHRGRYEALESRAVAERRGVWECLRFRRNPTS
jgi:Micrococcal nuclease (thermonuclease) homologs